MVDPLEHTLAACPRCQNKKTTGPKLDELCEDAAGGWRILCYGCGFMMWSLSRKEVIDHWNDYASALEAIKMERDEANEKVENAKIVASETQKDWKHRCYRIMGALGLDYGDPDWVMPDEQKKIDTIQSETAEACAKIADKWASDEQRKFGNGGPAVEIRTAFKIGSAV